MSKYIIELGDSAKKVVAIYLDEGCVWTGVQEVEDLEILNSGYINEHFSDLQDDAYNKGYAQCQDDYGDALKHAKDTAYQKGLEEGKKAFDLLESERNSEYQRGLDDAWEAARKVALNTNDGGLSMEKLDEIFDRYTLQQVLKDYTAKQTIEKLKAYEKKPEDKIEVGDEVYCKDDDVSDSGVVTWVGKDSIYAMWQDGSAGEVQKDELVKTGRRFDIASILEDMRND